MKKRRMNCLAILMAAMVLVQGCGAGETAEHAGVRTETSEETGAGAAADKEGTNAAASDEPDMGIQEEGMFDVSLQKRSSGAERISLENIPEFSGEPYVVLNDNEPEFSQKDFSEESYENYSELDALGRCGAATANIGRDLMPTEKRGSISQVKPSGWQSVQYDWVDGKSLYNRCHLIGYQLTAENANERNLITGTRFMNVEGMLPFENMVADYIDETDNHVLYRVTPIFEGDNLVASGVQMEAWSVEDDGEGICFNIYAYNHQPGVIIDYATGESYAEENGAPAQAGEEEDRADAKAMDSSLAASDEPDGSADEGNAAAEYILNTNTKKFHRPSCSNAKQIKDENRSDYSGNREDLISQGYEPCKNCNP